MAFTPPAIADMVVAFPEVANPQEIARGGYKVVYRAEIAGLPEVFKLVCLPSDNGTDEGKAYRRECLGRIRREVELLGKCQRPELVKLGHLPPRQTTIRGVDYVGYTEEFLDGPDLWKVLRAKGAKPSEAEAHRLLLSLLQAVAELWNTHKVIHRDIKPQNVIKLNNPDRPFVLLDLGIAFGVLDTGLTADQAQVPATPRYLAPEMARPDFRQNIDFRADLYTSALTVFEYSAQMHPLAKTADDLIQTISRALHQPPRQMKKERPDFSDAFCIRIDQMLKKKPMLRPSNIPALIAEMEVVP